MTSSVTRVVEALSSIRMSKRVDEKEIQVLVAGALRSAGIRFRREVRVAHGSRPDFLTYDGVVVEVKKLRPPQARVLKQLERYAEARCVKAVILVLERYMDLPEKINGKPCEVISLNKLWGIAL